MPIAYVDKDARVTEVRDLLEMSDVPNHKRKGWRPMVGDRPIYDGRTQMLVGPTLTVEPTRVVRTWDIVDRPAGLKPIEEPAPAIAVAPVVVQADTSALEERIAGLEAMLQALAQEARTP